MGGLTTTQAIILTATALGVGGGAGAAIASAGRDKSPSPAPQTPMDTGKMPKEDADEVARKRLFRSGVLFTGTGGIGGTEPTASARLR